MTGLTPDDVRHWDPSVINQLFESASGVYGTNHKLGEDLAHGESRVRDWRGEGADAFREEIGKARKDIDATGNQAGGVSHAIRTAEMLVSTCRGDMNDIDEVARGYGWTVTPTWQIDTSQNPPIGVGDPMATQLEALQGRLTTLQGQADIADHDLALAIRAAVGDAQVTPDGHEVHSAPPPQTAAQQQDASPRAPGPHPGDSLYGQHDGKRLTATMEPHVDPHGCASIPLHDNPPGYDQFLGSGAQRDQNWRNYLEGVNGDGSHRTYGSMPQALPKPEAVQDKALRTVGAAGRQQGVSYAWGANKFTDSPSQGHNATDEELRQLGATRQTDGSWLNNDGNRVGFDCGGLARFSVAQGTEGKIDLGGGTGNQFSHLTSGADSAVKGPALPGDLAYFGPGGNEHVAISVGNGVLIEARQSGEAIELLPTQIQGGTPQWMRPNY